jgi:8-oxo-dGTP pyrophosphatase MutT (NUDIX family)
LPLTAEQIRSQLRRYRPRPLLAAPPAELVAEGGRRLREAGVLVPLILRPEGVTILLTERTAHLKSHAGQISFPGGSREEGDATLADAALREAEEEVNLHPNRVELVGQLDEYETVTHFHITPVVGLIREPGPLHPEPGEVASIFELPLAMIMDESNFEYHERKVDGRSRAFYALPYEGHFIWGATAAMLRNLRTALTDTQTGHEGRQDCATAG